MKIPSKEAMAAGANATAVACVTILMVSAVLFLIVMAETHSRDAHLKRIKELEAQVQWLTHETNDHCECNHEAIEHCAKRRVDLLNPTSEKGR